MENKTLKLLMIKWLNYAYCLSEEPREYGILRILQCIEDIIDIANIREEEKKKLRELIQKSKDNLFNLSIIEFQAIINEVIEQIDKSCMG
jgi:hypothetical protein